MEKVDVKDADQIVQRLLNNLLPCIRDQGILGVTARTYIGWAMANSPVLLWTDQIGYPLDTCFDRVRQAGATMTDMEIVRRYLEVEQPQTLGGTMVRDRSIQLALAHMGKIISTMTFNSRTDIDDLIISIQIPFNDAEETAADTMDGADYQSLIQMRGALVNYLVSTSRSLPSMLAYQFTTSLPSLIIAYRLYADASRCDEIRNENKVVHPAFCPPQGRALSQ